MYCRPGLQLGGMTPGDTVMERPMPSRALCVSAQRVCVHSDADDDDLVPTSSVGPADSTLSNALIVSVGVT